MNGILYSQQATIWLQKLASWWSLLNRGTAIREVEKILVAAEDELCMVKTSLGTEQSLHQEAQTKLHDTHQKLDIEQTNHRITQNQLKFTIAKLGLITNTLGAQTEEHPKCLAFRNFFRDFVKFSNDENFYKREVDATLRLQAVEEAMRLLGRVPLFREKTIIAVAGGFSSGKSSLVTSFFDPKFKVTLPIGMDPVTAIPTYIASGSETSVIGFPAHGGTLDIEPEMFAQMRHEFLSSLGFDLRRILPFIMLETPWRNDWENLCFVDTPGYNAPLKGGGSTAADDKTTAEALRHADALLWVIGLDSNGEISNDDLEFLLDHGQHLPLAVVINKVDIRQPSQVRAVVDQIRETLDVNGIEYRCISAYSSIDAREHEYVGQSMDDFLGHWNQQRPQRDEMLCKEVLDVLDDYIEAFEKEIALHTKHKREIHSLKLDLDELGLFDDVAEKKMTRTQKSGIISRSFPLSGIVPGMSGADFARRGEIKEKVLEYLHQFSKLFAIEEIDAHKKEAKRLRDDVIRLFAQNWEEDDSSDQCHGWSRGTKVASF